MTTQFLNDSNRWTDRLWIKIRGWWLFINVSYHIPLKRLPQSDITPTGMQCLC